MYPASFKDVSSSLSLRFVRKTSNLLTGATEVDQTTVVELGKEMPTEIHSHLHPNLTIQIVDDHTPWVKGQVPAPLDEFIEFDKYVRHEEYYGQLHDCEYTVVPGHFAAVVGLLYKSLGIISSLSYIDVAADGNSDDTRALRPL